MAIFVLRPRREYIVNPWAHPQLTDVIQAIHSPLAAIRNAAYLARGRTDDPDAKRLLDIIDGEVHRIATLLVSLRAESEPELRRRIAEGDEASSARAA